MTVPDRSQPCRCYALKLQRAPRQFSERGIYSAPAVGGLKSMLQLGFGVALPSGPRPIGEFTSRNQPLTPILGHLTHPRPPPNPSQEPRRGAGVRARCQFPSWEGLGVGSRSQCMRENGVEALHEPLTGGAGRRPAVSPIGNQRGCKLNRPAGWQRCQSGLRLSPAEPQPKERGWVRRTSRSG